ncbi:hypothetical protein OIV83_000303 [Microbotryomycetes sp. JL201]|nr:hypothetical protein OIV83_000303 [Microbotryomycetes sp. JL201]
MAATAPAASAPPSESLTKSGDVHSTRIDVINTTGARILCVADIRGSISSLNALAAEHSASAIIHTGDFGFYEKSSLANISDRTLKHLIQYSSLISPHFRSQLLSPNTNPSEMRELLANTPKTFYPPDTAATQPYFGLSEFPRLLSGELRLNVPVYTVWGACEDVSILEKIRLAAPSELSIPADPSKVVPPPTERPTKTPGYSIPNLTVLDEATTRLLNIGGLKLRLFGLGGAVVPHKLFDNGSGTATIAGGSGTMWTTVLQVGELVDTAQKVYDPTEVRLLVTHASPGREGLLTQLALTLKADLTVSAGLHFRYGVSYNEFVVHHDVDSFRSKLEASKKAFIEVWDSVKSQVEAVVDDNQKVLLENALSVANRSAPASAEDAVYKNTWNWNLPDAMFGSLVLNVREGRVSSELKSQGFNFAYRAHSKSANAPPTSSAPRSHIPSQQTTSTTTAAASTTAPAAAPAPTSEQPASTGRGHHQNGTGFATRGTPRGPAGTSFHTRAPSGPGTGPRGGGGRFGGGWGRSDSSDQQQAGDNKPASGGEAARAAATAVTAEAAEAATVPVPGEEQSASAAAPSTAASDRGNASSPGSQQQGRREGRQHRDKSKFNQNNNSNSGEGKAREATSTASAASGGESGTQEAAAPDVSSPATPTTAGSSDRFASRGSARGGRGGRGGGDRGRGGRGGGDFGPRGRGRGGSRGGYHGGSAASGAEGGDASGAGAVGDKSGSTPAREPKSDSNKEGAASSGGEGRSNGWRGSPAPREPREPKEPRKW